MKYIVFQDDTAVIFANSVSHKEVANNRPVRSAGFCRIETYRDDYDDVRINASVWGESDTLNKKSSPEDAEVIKRIWR